MSESPVEITVAETGQIVVSDRIEGELIARAVTWQSTFRMVKAGGTYLPACRVCGELSPPDLEEHAQTHPSYVIGV